MHRSPGVTLHELGRYDEALAAHDRAVELAPDDADVHRSRGVTLFALERYAEALAAGGPGGGARPGRR